jgi:catechol 2,3-dioxygenase-like lactoylglutathione lyase family enzyme
MSSLFIAVNHPGFVVNDLAAASAFFVDVLGFDALPRKGSTSDPGGQRMTDWFGVDPTAESRWAFFRLGDDVVELMEWTAPDQNQTAPRNSDVGGRHLAISTPDLDAAIARVKDQPGVTVRAKTESGFVYISTPFGLEIQISPV